jgi:hypothetical protein
MAHLAKLQDFILQSCQDLSCKAARLYLAKLPDFILQSCQALSCKAVRA